MARKAAGARCSIGWGACALSLLLACNGSSPGAPRGDQKAPAAGGGGGAGAEATPAVTYRRLERSFGSFDVPAESPDGWRVAQDGVPKTPAECKDEAYRSKYPIACAPVPGPKDLAFSSRLVLPGVGMIDFHFQGYPHSQSPEKMLADEKGRAFGAAVERTRIVGAPALTIRREHTDIGSFEEGIAVSLPDLFLRWQVIGPLTHRALITAIARRVRDTLELNP